MPKTTTEFRWLIEAPGPKYLATRETKGASFFHWIEDAKVALAFGSREQAHGLMMAVRQTTYGVFDFEQALGEARPVEHGFDTIEGPAGAEAFGGDPGVYIRKRSLAELAKAYEYKGGKTPDPVINRPSYIPTTTVSIETVGDEACDRMENFIEKPPMGFRFEAFKTRVLAFVRALREDRDKWKAAGEAVSTAYKHGIRSPKLDSKFYGTIFKIKDGSHVPDDEYVVFLAKDNAFATLLPIYRAICVSLGSDHEQIAAVDRMIGRLYDWRLANIDKCKVPGAKGEKLIDLLGGVV